jgi:predicted transcriptional regulator
VHASVGRIEINGELFARVGSVMLAADLAHQLRELARQPASSRAAAIESAVRASLEESRASEVWSAFHRETRGLAIVTTALLAYTFVVAPVIILGIAPHPYWMYVLAGLLALALAAAILFFRLHSRLYPAFAFERWMHAISMVAIPIAAIRAVDKLSRERLRSFSAAVVAPALCGVTAATPLLRRAWFDLPDASAAPDRCTAWFLERVRKETKAALDRQHVPILSAPEAQPAMARYCPRCHTQFTTAARRDCSECAGVQLVSF